jgi:putative membrane protein
LPEDLSVPRRLHPITPALDLIVQLRTLALPILILALGGLQGVIGAGTIVIFLAAVLGVRFLRWTCYSYRIEDGALRIEEGILQRRQRTVPLARIQQVDVQRALRHRLAGVAALRVDTAGGSGGADATLEVISLDEADRLRRVLLAGRDQARAPEPGSVSQPGSAPEAGEAASAPAAAGQVGLPGAAGGRDHDEGEVLVRLSAALLAVGGITGARLAAVLVVVTSVLRLADDLPEGTMRDLLETLPTGTTALLVLVLVGLPVSLAVAAASGWLTDGGFTLRLRADAVHVRRGVLDQREAGIGLQRIQAVRIEQNPLRRALGLAQVQLQSAGSGTTAGGDVTRITVPVMRVRALDALLARVLPGFDGLPELVAAPAAARRRAVVRRVAPTGIVVTGVALVGDPPVAGLVGLAGLVAVALALGELAYRGLGHATVPGHVVARRGTLTRETVVVPVARTQSTRLRSSPFQRRAGLASLHIDVAGRGRTPTIVDGPARLLAQLRTSVLDTRAARADEAAIRARTRAA